jgi:hypothetical protein
MGIFDLFKKKNAQGKKLNLRDDWKDIDPEIVTMHVRVVDHGCFVTKRGTQVPIIEENYVVAFEDTDGNRYEMNVGFDLYDGFEVGQVGELTLIDGNVSSYVLDEDI